MSNLDALVTRDLAAAAATNRERLVPIDATLRAVGAAAPGAVPEQSTGSALRLLVLANIYAARVARSASGLAALVCVLVIVTSSLASYVGLRDYTEEGIGGAPIGVASKLVLVVLAVRLIAGAWASAAFARTVGTSPGQVERMVERSERWSLLLGILGTFVFLMTFGVAYFTLRTDSLDYFPCAFDASCWSGAGDAVTYKAAVRDLAIVVPIVSIGALVVVRRPAAWRARGATIALGVLILAITLCVGYRYDDGPWGPPDAGLDYAPNPVLRLGLTITGAIGMIVALTSLALWRRRRERDRLASASSGS
jgi:lipid-A-disaccharide synthase-like uncharacterized protein